MKIGQKESREEKIKHRKTHQKRIVKQDKNGNGNRQNKNLNQRLKNKTKTDLKKVENKVKSKEI